MTNIWHFRSSFKRFFPLVCGFFLRNATSQYARIVSVFNEVTFSEIQDVSIENYWEIAWPIIFIFGTVSMRDEQPTGISFTKRNSCEGWDWVSSITSPSTWRGTAEETSLIVSLGIRERKLSDIKSSHNGSSKEIKSINNSQQHKKERTVTQRKLPAIKISSGEKKGDFLHNWILFIFCCFDLLSGALRKRISFHDFLKRGIKKIKYLSFCARQQSPMQLLNLTIFHFRLFMNSVARVRYR